MYRKSRETSRWPVTYVTYVTYATYATYVTHVTYVPQVEGDATLACVLDGAERQAGYRFGPGVRQAVAAGWWRQCSRSGAAGATSAAATLTARQVIS